MFTPWGTSDAEYDYAPNKLVVFYTTPSHGGFKVQSPLNEMIPANVRSNDGWYEEDCEWAIVAYTFPSLFVGRGNFGEDTQKIRQEAHDTIKRWWPEKAVVLDVSGPRTV